MASLCPLFIRALAASAKEGVRLSLGPFISRENKDQTVAAMAGIVTGNGAMLIRLTDL